MTKRRFGSILAGLGCVTLAGCGEPLGHVELIDKTRVLGAKVVAGADPTRAAPLPGEAAEVTWLVVAPEPDAAFAYALSACIAADSSSDLPHCAGEPFATGASLAPTRDAPRLAFEVPADAPGDARIVIEGAVCPAGESLLDEGGLDCSDGTRAARVSLDFALDDGNHPNTNPVLTDITLDGESLAAETAASTDCAELPSVRAGSGDHALGVELDPVSRDALTPARAGDPTRESLLVSYFITRGALDHALSALDSASTATGTSAVWTPPGAPAEAAPARFIVVVRDGRGGSDFAERRVCVVP